MTAATLFSGIGAPEVAMPGWHWPWHAEIEKFPSAVMAARHPDSVNLGDVSADDFTERAAEIARPDLIVFGSPCQSYSIAGKRLGLDDPRGNLALVALGIIARLKPCGFVFENVPGLLSSSEGCDFGIFLRTVDELGYSGAWASLDAQWFGVAQRRERLFFVGHSGDWRHSAAVLLEPESLCGNHPPRRQAGQGTAGTIEASLGRSCGAGTPSGALTGFNNTGQGWWDKAETAASVRKGDDAGGGGARESTLVASTGNLAHCLNAGGMGRIDYETETLVTHALRADGFDASEDGTGRGTPLVPVRYRTSGNCGAWETGDKTDALTTGTDRSAHLLAFSSKDYGADLSEEIAPTLRAMGHQNSHANAGGQLAVAFAQNQIGEVRASDVVGTLNTNANANASGRATAMANVGSAVRRLTPRECERLQGFPDDYTLISYRGKPAADGPRYKALGNSMAVPVMRWILSRIESTIDRE